MRNPAPPSPRISPATAAASLALLLLAFLLRTAGLDTVPPGWRDDEALETTVHAQIVLDGHFPLYFIQAEGHEPLFHYLSAGWISLVGHSLFSVRMVSAFFGLLTVAACFRFARQVFGWRTALLASFLISVSFWALMYSRFKLRHMAEVPLVLLGFSALFSAISRRYRPARLRAAAAAVLFLSAGLYVYLGAVTALITLTGFGVYLGLLAWTSLERRQDYLQRIGLVAGVLAMAVLIYLPLAAAIRTNAARLAVVGGPLTALRTGDPVPLLDHAAQTLGMFAFQGDNEALYNIPGRPVFGAIGFFFFAAGLLLALVRWRQPRYAFLLIWLVAGMAPAFASNPPGSLGHTLTSLPAVYLLAVLPVTTLSWPARRTTLTVLAALLLAAVALRDLPDYFLLWPALPQVQFLYKADLHARARKLRGLPPMTYVLSGTLSKWDKAAFDLEPVVQASPARWVDAAWAIVFPPSQATYLFARASWQTNTRPQLPLDLHFSNGLTLKGLSWNGRDVYVRWAVGAGFTAVEPDMGSSVDSPPFPVKAFVHLLDSGGSFVAGSDRFDVDAFTLQAGDEYLQRHSFDAPPGTYLVEIGLYDPASGQRYTTDDGRDAVRAGSARLP